jgi:hypothetical protein
LISLDDTVPAEILPDVGFSLLPHSRGISVVKEVIEPLLEGLVVFVPEPTPATLDVPPEHSATAVHKGGTAKRPSLQQGERKAFELGGNHVNPTSSNGSPFILFRHKPQGCNARMLRDWNSWTAHENQGDSLSCSPYVVKKVSGQLRTAFGPVHPANIKEIVPLNPILAPKGIRVGLGWGFDPDPEDRTGNSFVCEHTVNQVPFLRRAVDDPGGRAENLPEDIQIEIWLVMSRGNEQAPI